MMLRSMFFGRSWNDWIAQYGSSHRTAANRACHTIGIPLIMASLPLFIASPWLPGTWRLPAALFVVGWLFQFIGHAFEGKRPEFFHDWRFLFVGARWWFAKIRGKA
jgi:uncharacterized membrane protein YGL010W